MAPPARARGRPREPRVAPSLCRPAYPRAGSPHPFALSVSKGIPRLPARGAAAPTSRTLRGITTPPARARGRRAHKQDTPRNNHPAYPRAGSPHPFALSVSKGIPRLPARGAAAPTSRTLRGITTPPARARGRRAHKQDTPRNNHPACPRAGPPAYGMTFGPANPPRLPARGAAQPMTARVIASITPPARARGRLTPRTLLVHRAHPACPCARPPPSVRPERVEKGRPRAGPPRLSAMRTCLCRPRLPARGAAKHRRA